MKLWYYRRGADRIARRYFRLEAGRIAPRRIRHEADRIAEHIRREADCVAAKKYLDGTGRFWYAKYGNCIGAAGPRSARTGGGLIHFCEYGDWKWSAKDQHESLCLSDLYNSAMVIKILMKVDIFTASLFHCQFAMFFCGNNTFSILTLRFA